MKRQRGKRVSDLGWWEKGIAHGSALFSGEPELLILWPGSLVGRLVGVTLAMIIRGRHEGANDFAFHNYFKYPFP